MKTVLFVLIFALAGLTIGCRRQKVHEERLSTVDFHGDGDISIRSSSIFNDSSVRGGMWIRFKDKPGRNVNAGNITIGNGIFQPDSNNNYSSIHNRTTDLPGQTVPVNIEGNEDYSFLPVHTDIYVPKLILSHNQAGDSGIHIIKNKSIDYKWVPDSAGKTEMMLVISSRIDKKAFPFRSIYSTYLPDNGSLSIPWQAISRFDSCYALRITLYRFAGKSITIGSKNIVIYATSSMSFPDFNMKEPAAKGVE